MTDPTSPHPAPEPAPEPLPSADPWTAPWASGPAPQPVSPPPAAEPAAEPAADTPDDAPTDGQTAPAADAPAGEGDSPLLDQGVIDAAAALAGKIAQQDALPLADPDPDEGGPEVVLVSNGWARFNIGGLVYKTRRPFLAELRGLEEALATDREAVDQLKRDLDEFSARQMERAEAIQEEARALPKDHPRRQELDQLTGQLIAETTAVVNQHREAVRQSRVDWWLQVFKVLTPPGHTPPDALPAWVTNPAIQRQIIAHWQSNPLARGGG